MTQAESPSWTNQDDKSLLELLGIEDNRPVENRVDEQHLRIIGLEPNFVPDDISTIANDTLGQDLAYTTPKKPQYVQFGDDETDTQPETPSKYQPFNATDKKDVRTRSSSRIYRLLSIAACLATVLICAIGILSYTLFAIRNDSSDATSPSTEEDTFDRGAALEFDFDFRSTSPTSAPTLVAIPDRPSSAKSIQSISTIIQETASNFYDNQASSLFDDNKDSTKYQVLEWLANDPNNYLPEQLVQRYALSVVYASLSSNDPTADARTSRSGGWMTYTDECSWRLSRDTISLCNEEGRAQYLYLENSDLDGTLASEIGLLSSLQMIFLTSNAIGGSIPSEIGFLSQLERLNLPRNKMIGSIPSEIQNLQRLAVLGLGNNSFTNSLPVELGSLGRLTSLLLQNNAFNGRLPDELSNLSQLAQLQLSSNNFEGSIPFGLGNIATLRTITVENNNLSGEMPPQICARENLLSVTVDCGSISCTCCNNCNVFAETPTDSVNEPVSTAVPTAAPTISVQVEAATKLPTIRPSPAPTASATDSPSVIDMATTPNPTLLPGTTLSPTECYAVRPLRECHLVDEPIEVSISICDPVDGDDLLAMYRLRDIQNSGLRNALFWEPSCGEQSCTGVILDDLLTYSVQGFAFEIENVDWPLREDDYVFLLLRFIGDGRLAVLAETFPFQVSNSCDGNL